VLNDDSCRYDAFLSLVTLLFFNKYSEFSSYLDENSANVCLQKLRETMDNLNENKFESKYT
jgi:hypothetical protein